MTQISLISEQWIPVRDRKGVVRKISPLEILDEEIVDIAAERADFQTALWQFLIGLIQTTWRRRMKTRGLISGKKD